MKKFFVIISHNLNHAQIDAINKELNIQQIEFLPDNLKSLWGNIPADVPSIMDIIKPFKDYLKNNANIGDYVLIQGDMGCTYALINYAFSLGLIPCYATTKRITITEEDNNGVVNLNKQFKHIMYRKYEQ